jgi:uncharacterized protein (DUF2126 family)/transglutaminase-like putative cysteine protease
MPIHVALNHASHYAYDRRVQLGPQVIRLRPAPHSRTPILSYSLRVTPKPHFLNWQQDPQSNWLARVVFPDRVAEFKVEVDLVAEMSVINPFDFFLNEDAKEYPFYYDPVLVHELAPFHRKLDRTPLFAEFLQSVDITRRRTVDFLVDLNQKVREHIRYTIRMEPGVQTPEQTLEFRSGSCRDTAWLLAQLLRHLGLASRFVSGYLIQLTADRQPIEGPAGPPQDFTDLHAWTEVYLPGAGWVGLDGTSGLFTGEGHIPVAATPEPASAAAISGTLEDCETTATYHMSLRRIYESPRVTKPYADEVWENIESLGHQIDRELAAGDVRLTMGGEPTFVSAVDMEGPEWTTLALSPAKRHLAMDLVKRLRRRFAPGGFLHFGQGKWYPGEQLPRWAFTCAWRKDGQPIWHDPALVADETRDNNRSRDDARHFIETLARRLRVHSNYAFPGYEDLVYYLWRERRLPVNVNIFDSKLEDEAERNRLARVFEQGFQTPAGFGLPLDRHEEWHYGEDGSLQRRKYWVTGLWPVRSERLFLIPGDSPMGYRLPLNSLPFVTSTHFPSIHEPDPLMRKEPLPAYRQLRRYGYHPRAGDPYGIGGAGYGQGEPPDLEEPMAPPPEIEKAEDAFREVPDTHPAHIIRTALCAEVRNGVLYVFMPPTRTLEDYLDLVAAIEDTATRLSMPVVCEGYPPHPDHRLHTLAVTPDPGVIEVNLHASSNWDELVERTTGLYEEARQTRLGAEKFMLDGRHTGTGGGNHIVLGGETPADSPFLRRPELLRSLLTYWHNHPSLSYLFSGLFIGPTSQSPRVDEARNDSTYELQIAFSHTPHGVNPCAPWIVDRLYRNLLIDVTGNTHRAEFCIDKLYPPDAGGRRLGLVEMRPFEMPPHERMSLTQQLLLRSLVAWFWKHPHERRLAQWDTGLHDQFMLPHFVWQDFSDVIDDLRDQGYPLELDWFAPHFEFRFPRYGEIVKRGVQVELRSALEPWVVLGEDTGIATTVRYVDSSVERLQVKVRGMVDERHVMTCNGRRVPLHPTGTVGEFVAGVRYRAWQPAECLHPTIPIHSPLTFDLLDTWNGRSIGGCAYHVSHPGGLSYDIFPVNAFEAESRRNSRFFPFGHTPGPMPIPPLEENRDFPLTLDMRLRPGG